MRTILIIVVVLIIVVLAYYFIFNKGKSSDIMSFFTGSNNDINNPIDVEVITTGPSAVPLPSRNYDYNTWSTGENIYAGENNTTVRKANGVGSKLYKKDVLIGTIAGLDTSAPFSNLPSEVKVLINGQIYILSLAGRPWTVKTRI